MTDSFVNNTTRVLAYPITRLPSEAFALLYDIAKNKQEALESDAGSQFVAYPQIFEPTGSLTGYYLFLSPGEKTPDETTDRTGLIRLVKLAQEQNCEMIFLHTNNLPGVDTSKEETQVLKMLTVSTAHLSSRTRKSLNQDTLPYRLAFLYKKDQYGWFLHPDLSAMVTLFRNMYGDIGECVQTAWKHHIDILCLDNDGQVYADLLPVYPDMTETEGEKTT